MRPEEEVIRIMEELKRATMLIKIVVLRDTNGDVAVYSNYPSAAFDVHIPIEGSATSLEGLNRID